MWWRQLAVLALLTTTAAADSWPASVTSVDLRIAGDRIEATVVGLERKNPLSLREGDRSVEPMIVRPFNQGKPLALMLVVEGTELAMGAERLPVVEQAIDSAELSKILPSDSLASVITYSEKPSVIVAWKPVEELTGADLGTVERYQGHTGNNLVDAASLAIEMLSKRPEPHKLMIIIGDGTAPTGDKADATVRELRARTKDMDIVALVVPHDELADEISVDELTDRARESSLDALGQDFTSAFDVATLRFEATFELARFPRDGQEHTFRLMWGESELGSARLKMPGTPPPSKTWRYLVVLGVMAAFGAVSLFMFKPRIGR